MRKTSTYKSSLWQRARRPLYGAALGGLGGTVALLTNRSVAFVLLAGLITVSAYAFFMSYQKSISRKWTPRAFAPAPMMGAMVIGVMSIAGVNYLGSSSASQDFSIWNVNTPNCTIKVVGTSHQVGKPNSQFREVGNLTAETTVIVTGNAACTKTVTLASWTAPYGRASFTPIKDQKLFTSKSYTLKAGTHVLSVAYADCLYQIDMLYGPSITTPQGTAEYPEDQKLGWVQAGKKVCYPPVPTPTPVPTPVPTAPAPTPTEVVTPVSKGGELPRTGTASNVIIIAAFAILTGYLFSAIYNLTSNKTKKA